MKKERKKVSTRKNKPKVVHDLVASQGAEMLGVVTTIEDAVMKYGMTHDFIVNELMNNYRELKEIGTDVNAIREARYHLDMFLKIVGGYAPDKKITANVEYKWVVGEDE